MGCQSKKSRCSSGNGWIVGGNLGCSLGWAGGCWNVPNGWFLGKKNWKNMKTYQKICKKYRVMGMFSAKNSAIWGVFEGLFQGKGSRLKVKSWRVSGGEILPPRSSRRATKVNSQRILTADYRRKTQIGFCHGGVRSHWEIGRLLCTLSTKAYFGKGLVRGSPADFVLGWPIVASTKQFWEQLSWSKSFVWHEGGGWAVEQRLLCRCAPRNDKKGGVKFGWRKVD